MTRRSAESCSSTVQILRGDCLQALTTLPRGVARLIYIDPPFNTGRIQRRQRMVVRSDESGTRHGFHGRRYSVGAVSSPAYADTFNDYLAFLLPRIEAGLRCLAADGSIFVHLDDRESHYVKVALDAMLGRDHFMNEIIWAYDYGGRARRRWPRKHDTILWYVADPDNYVYRYEAIDRIPYMAPNLVTPEKAARGKTPTDVWWNTIVPTTSKEKTGYPTQKPRAILDRIVNVHSEPGDTVLDFFAGSGTTGASALALGRNAILIDSSREAIRIMKARLKQ